MIREWCEGCGDHLCSRVDWDGETRLFCRDMCGSSDGPTINDVAAAFWSAIAHERARTERHAAVYTLSAMLSEEIVALASLDAADRTDPARFDEVRAEAMRLVDLIQREVGK